MIRAMNDSSREPWRERLGTRTRTEAGEVANPERVLVPGLTLLSHPLPVRVGDIAWLPELLEGGSVEIGRGAPAFLPPRGGPGHPLGDACISRQPVRVEGVREGFVVHPSPGRNPVYLDGLALEEPRELPPAALDQGVGLAFGNRVALLLHRGQPLVDGPPAFGLIGESHGLQRLRRQVEAVADLDLPILIRGESGTGKELVAQALHRHGPRARRPYHALNMAAVDRNLAVAELFGARRGAFTGADRDREGFFQRADGGTLFLDEIGEASLEVQALLLRALESGEVQALGADRVRRVDVRILAATDADLEQACREGSFSEPLMYRLQGLEVRLPPLRERRDDLGRLFFHFLQLEMENLGEGETWRALRETGAAYVPARLLTAMAGHSWPGNVRELRNAVRERVVASRGRSRLRLGPWRPSPPSAQAEGATSAEERTPDTLPSTPPVHRDPSSVPPGRWRAALRRHRWNVKAAAREVGLSRASLYNLMEQSPDIRIAAELDRATLEAALERWEGDLEAASAELEVSLQGLKRRLKQLEREEEL